MRYYYFIFYRFSKDVAAKHGTVGASVNAAILQQKPTGGQLNMNNMFQPNANKCVIIGNEVIQEATNQPVAMDSEQQPNLNVFEPHSHADGGGSHGALYVLNNNEEMIDNDVTENDQIPMQNVDLLLTVSNCKYIIMFFINGCILSFQFAMK